MKIITDLGQSPVLINPATGEIHALGRFGVWVVNRRYEKDEVIDTGDDLEALQDKHGPGLTVYPINTQKNGSGSGGSAY